MGGIKTTTQGCMTRWRETRWIAIKNKFGKGPATLISNDQE